jgi:predicted  nucleic acid-binding Zn-ribbon protein
MGELVIQYHDFENAKKEIKKFSEQTTTDLDLKRVDDSKGVGEFLGDWFFGRGIGKDHLVKGEELNDLTSQIQTYLHSINNTQIKLIKEFGQVYSALEALDKDYIQAILISIKATEETSEGIQKTQEQIKKIVENQRKTLEELKKFKQKLDGYAHLGDIDKIWGDCQKWHQDMASLTKEISAATEHGKDNDKKIEALKSALSTAEKKTGDLSVQISQMIERLESVTAFTSALEKITHLQDVDEMWESLITAHEALKNIGSDIEALKKGAAKHQEEINKLLAFVEKVSSLEHLMDVDKMWSCTEEQKHHLKEIDCISGEQAGRLESLASENDKIAKRVSANEQDIKNLNESVNKFKDITHLDDVDSTWDTVKEHSGQLTQMEKQNEAIVTSVQENKEDVEAKIVEANNAIASLTQKIKYAYLIAGGTAGLAIIELILLLV